jgi:hypothetical protein
MDLTYVHLNSGNVSIFIEEEREPWVHVPNVPEPVEESAVPTVTHCQPTLLTSFDRREGHQVKGTWVRRPHPPRHYCYKKVGSSVKSSHTYA